MHYHKVLILGSNGTLGQALVGEFEKAGCQVFAWNRNELDITDKPAVKEKISKLSPDIIINATAIVTVDEIERDDETYRLAKKINGEAVGDMAKIAEELDVPIVHFSTDYVFDGEKSEGYKEEDNTHPINKYGETKLLGENLLKSNCDKYYIIRISFLFGKAGNSQKQSFLDWILGSIQNPKQDSIPCVDSEVCSPSYVVDVAEFTHKILEEGYSFGIYHGANDGKCSRCEFAREVLKIKKSGIGIKIIDSESLMRPSRRPKYSVLLNTKMPNQRGWEEALGEYLK